MGVDVARISKVLRIEGALERTYHASTDGERSLQRPTPRASAQGLADVAFRWGNRLGV